MQVYAPNLKHFLVTFLSFAQFLPLLETTYFLHSVILAIVNSSYLVNTAKRALAKLTLNCELKESALTLHLN